MSNSKLICYTKLSPNCNKPRNHKIDKITIHHMAGNATIEAIGEDFSRPEREGSSNYGVGSDGRVGMYVEEANRSWASSNEENDHRAITIEVANDGGEPDWHVSDKALESTIALCVDICQRNGIKALNFTGDKTGNLTMHKWFAATACPGPYLESKFPYIAEEVNRRLGGTDTEEELYRIQVGAYKIKPSAGQLLLKVKKAGFAPYLVEADGYFKVHIGPFKTKADADAALIKVKASGFPGFLTTKGGKAVAQVTPIADKISAGDTVMVNKGAKTYTGDQLASFVYSRKHKVSELKGDRAVITYDGVVVAAVKLVDLTKV